MTPRVERFAAWKARPGRSTLVALLETSQGRAFAICCGVLQDRHDAEEAAQETLLKIVSGLDRVSDASRFEHWADQVAYRTALDRKKSKRRRKERELQVARRKRAGAEPYEGLHDAIARLEDEDRTLILERYFDRRTFDEMGRSRGLSDVGIRKRIQKAHHRLKRLLGCAFPGAWSGWVSAGIATMTSKSAAGFTIIVLSLLLLGGGIWVTSGSPGREAASKGKAEMEMFTQPDRPISPEGFDSETVKSDRNQARKTCREILARGVLGFESYVGARGHSIAAVHRMNPRFHALAESFCRLAGEDLVPICRELLSDCESEASAFMIAALLGHSRRHDAFDLLEKLATRGQGPPALSDLYASAIYSIGMIRSPRSAPYLLKLYSETPGAQSSLAGKFGTPLMAAIGMLGREGVVILKESALRELTPEYQPTAEEGLRAFRWTHLGLINSPEALTELKLIAEREPDVRVRGMAIAAMGQSVDPEQRAYLADLYSRDQDPVIRRAVVEALLDGISASHDEWNSMRERMAGPLASILKASRLPSGDEMLDYSVIRLAAETRSPESIKVIDDWIRVATQGGYEGEYFWHGIAVSALARQGASPERLDSFLSAQKSLTPHDRAYIMAQYYLESSPSTVAPTPHVAELIRALEGADPKESTAHNLLIALSRIPNAREEASGCLEGLIARSPDAETKIAYIDAGMWGTMNLAPALEKSIKTTDDLSVLLHASRTYLHLLPAEVPLESGIRDRIKALFTAETLHAITGEKFAERWSTPGALVKAIGLYFNRFGTPKDLPWLDSLPRTFGNPVGLRADLVDGFQSQLAWECTRAADAIRLRAR
jgi:RNA polymerase sigma factor (sigma-70 family)